MELLAAFGLFVIIASAAAWTAVRFWARPKAAIERVTEGREETAARMLPHPSLAFRDLMSRLGTVLPRSPQETKRVERQLIRAGYRGPGAIRVFYGAKIGLAVLLPVLVFVLMLGSEDTDSRNLAAAGAAALGFAAPARILKSRVKRRQKQIRRGLPNALDLMVICVESGLGLDQAIIQTAKELEHAHPEISEEFALVNFELRAGKRRVEALRNLASRSAVDELKKLVAVLVQADRFGTGIAQTLRGHADYMRVQARQTAEEKAAKLGIKLVFPIFFCILPSLFVVTVGPMVVRIMRDVLPMMRDM